MTACAGSRGTAAGQSNSALGWRRAARQEGGTTTDGAAVWLHSQMHNDRPQSALKVLAEATGLVERAPGECLRLSMVRIDASVGQWHAPRAGCAEQEARKRQQAARHFSPERTLRVEGLW